MIDKDRLKHKSIELGFKGVLSEDFYLKLYKTKKIRLRLKLELFGFVCLSLLFLYATQLENVWPTLRFTAVVFFFLCFAMILRILWIFHDINHIKKLRFAEHALEDVTKDVSNK
jgi:hypothetical protein